jgi:uncharacterized membrane protein YedE/YeeE
MDMASNSSRPGQALVGLLAGTAFGLGLGVSQMVDPRKVLGFLDIAGAWDPSLMFVLGGAVGVTALGFRFVLRRPAPLLGDRFHLSRAVAIDAPLCAGAVLFGIGWGLAGYCPGPAIASLGFANPEALWFLPAMLAGIGLQRWQLRRRKAQRTPTPA